MGYHVHNILKVRLSEFTDSEFFIFFFSPYGESDKVFWRFANAIHKQAVVLWDGQEWAEDIFTAKLPPYISSHAFWYNPVIVITIGKEEAESFQAILAKQFATSQLAVNDEEIISQDFPGLYALMADDITEADFVKVETSKEFASPFTLSKTFIITFDHQQSELASKALQVIASLIATGEFSEIVTNGGASRLGSKLANTLKTMVGRYKNAIFFNPKEIREWGDVDSNKPFDEILDESEGLLDNLRWLGESQTKYLEEYLSALQKGVVQLEEEFLSKLAEVQSLSQKNIEIAEKLLSNVENDDETKTQVKLEVSLGADFFGSGIKGVLEVSKDISDRVDNLTLLSSKVKKSNELMKMLSESEKKTRNQK